MRIDVEDLDYPLIAQSFEVVDKHREDWKKYQDLFNTVVDEKQKNKAKGKRRANKVSPIGRDVIKIIRSIFTTSFLTNKTPMIIEKLGSEDDERARQLRLACAYHWEKSEPYLELSKAFLSMLVFPVGVVSQYWCETRQRQIVRYENPVNVAFDVAATNPSDVEYVCYKYKKTGRDLLQKFKSDAKKKKEDRFYNKVDNWKEEFFISYDEKTFKPFERHEIEEIYIRVKEGWLCKTYSSKRGIHLRTVKFERLPFQWGFALEQLDSVDENELEESIMSYGESLISKIEFHIKEINQRLSQQADLIEKHINPDVFIGSKAKVNVANLDKGPGTKIPVGDIKDIQERQAPSILPVHDDIALRKQDIEETTGVNGILQGDTSPSDRRSMGSLALLNSQSSTRVEEMITMANATLFSHLIKTFVRSVYKNVSATTLMELGVQEPMIGRDVKNKPFDLTVKTEFGSEAKNLERFNDLMSIVQMLGQFPNANIETVEKYVEEATRLKIGDEDESYKRIFNQQVSPIVNGGI